MNFGVDFVALERDQKTKQCLHHQRIMESHIAAYAKEIVRSLAMQYVPTDVFDKSKNQVLRERTPAELEEVVNRGIWIAERTYQCMAAKGWLAEVPGLQDLLEAEESSVGFSGGQ